MPFAVAYCTVTGLPLACESVTVKVAGVVPELPSVTEASLIVMVGGASSSLMVTMPVPSSMVALLGVESVTENVSLGSSTRSPTMVTGTTRLVTNGAKVIIPEPVW